MKKSYLSVIKRGLTGLLAAAMVMTTAPTALAAMTSEKDVPISTEDYVVTIDGKDFDILSQPLASLAALTEKDAASEVVGEVRLSYVAADSVLAAGMNKHRLTALTTPVDVLVAAGKENDFVTSRGIGLGSTKMEMLAAYPKPDANLGREITKLLTVNNFEEMLAMPEVKAALLAADIDVLSGKDVKTSELEEIVKELRAEWLKADIGIYYYGTPNMMKDSYDFYANYKSHGRFDVEDYSIVIVTVKNKVEAFMFVSNAILENALHAVTHEYQEMSYSNDTHWAELVRNGLGSDLASALSLSLTQGLPEFEAQNKPDTTEATEEASEEATEEASEESN